MRNLPYAVGLIALRQADCLGSVGGLGGALQRHEPQELSDRRRQFGQDGHEVATLPAELHEGHLAAGHVDAGGGDGVVGVDEGGVRDDGPAVPRDQLDVGVV